MKLVHLPISLGLFVLASPALAGPLDPPAGPVAPTMKSLTEVEPRTALNAANTPGDSSSVFRITQPGSYYLTGNLLAPSTKNGILVDADDVSIDLNGFTISGGRYGVAALKAHDGISIANGRIRGAEVAVMMFDGKATRARMTDLRVADATNTGLRLGAKASVMRCSITGAGSTAIILGTDSVVRDTEISDCAAGILGSTWIQVTGCIIRTVTYSGITIGGSATVDSCTVAEAGEYGINVSYNASVTNCTVTACETGIRLNGAASTVTNCRSNFNSGPGFDIAADNEMERCVADRNGGAGIIAGYACVVRASQARRNGLQGIVIGSNSTLVDSFATWNGQSGNYAGIWIDGSECRVEANQSTGNDFGYFTTGSDNIIIRNAARGNTTNFSIAAGNEMAPVLTNPGSSGYSGATAWSNIAY